MDPNASYKDSNGPTKTYTDQWSERVHLESMGLEMCGNEIFNRTKCARLKRTLNASKSLPEHMNHINSEYNDRGRMILTVTK